ncbi:hypothetical protein K8T06_18275, partial [bacterium]|nr:hypothetical protein [bacterium]
MTYLNWFAYPYIYLLQDWVTFIVPVVIFISLTGIVLDWVLPALNRRKGRLTLLLVSVNLLLVQDQFLNNKHWIDVFLISIAAVLLLIYGIMFRTSIKSDWIRDLKPLPYWIGLIIIIAVTGVKLVELSTWPPFLKSYSAMTGKWGLNAIENHWPNQLFQGRGFDLRGGGQSPLMLPVMWLVMKFAGITVFSVRFSEVIGSTILLVILWSWLRTSIPGKWSVVALAVFGLSPWHLAQSRMGTFFSISAAIAFGLLWCANNAWRSKNTWKTTIWWSLLGIFAGCIGWCYAPMKVLYPFFFTALVGIPAINRFKQKKWWMGSLAALTMFIAIFGLQMYSVANPSSMFKSHFGPLATDNPVWRKTVDDTVQNSVQPASIIATNIKRNFKEWMQTTFRNHSILPIYAPALVISLILALLCLINWWNPVLSAYYLFGLLPPLIIFPLHRRTLIIWPLVYVTATIIFREISVTSSALFKRSSLKRLTHAFAGACLVIIMLLGLQIWINTWSIVLDHTYFGPPWRLTAMDRAADLMPTHRVVFVNPWVHRDTIEISLYEQNKKLGGNSLMFANIGKNSTKFRQ